MTETSQVLQQMEIATVSYFFPSNRHAQLQFFDIARLRPAWVTLRSVPVVFQSNLRFDIDMSPGAAKRATQRNPAETISNQGAA